MTEIIFFKNRIILDNFEVSRSQVLIRNRVDFTLLKCSEPSSFAGRCENRAARVQLKAAPSANSADMSITIRVFSGLKGRDRK